MIQKEHERRMDMWGRLLRSGEADERWLRSLDREDARYGYE
jgi:hypothetical protein